MLGYSTVFAIEYTYFCACVQLRLSEVVEGVHQLFLDLADSSDVFTAQVTPLSFYKGLTKKGVSTIYIVIM